MPGPMKLSIIVPVYNENRTIRRVLEEIQAVPIDKEIIIVDDGSTDGTRQILAQDKANHSGLRVILHEQNMGKGKAIRSGIVEAAGDLVIIQDADLEYRPMDYLALVDAIAREGAHVVYGSRFLGKKGVTSPWHRAVNFALTCLTNVLFGTRLTDMETCYKLYPSSVLKGLTLVSDGFEIEAELTAKVLKQGVRISEVPISYQGRTYHEGKKIGWRDGLRTVWALFKYRLSR